jgi:hypothetical protein
LKITRKVFINRRNNQASITIPSKILKELQEISKKESPIKKILLDISIPIDRDKK